MSVKPEHLPYILTHRALEPDNSSYSWGESTLQGFSDQAQRGFGLEFDLVETADQALVVLHDSNLNRLTASRDGRSIAQITLQELRTVPLATRGTIALFSEILALIESASSPLHALHLKARLHPRASLERIANVLKSYPAVENKIICFDTLREPTRFLKNRFPAMKFAPSVAHPWDIERYGKATGETLITVEALLAERELYDWAWLDEWDLTAADGGAKTLYCPEVFATIRNAGVKIALVMPELHGTSPGLLGGEAHPDAQSEESLLKRWREILKLQPDAVCTDYPEELKKLAAEAI